jgi:predicted RNA-binding Zn-ribbon protein involved in translation (DUF1610 family)
MPRHVPPEWVGYRHRNRVALVSVLVGLPVSVCLAFAGILLAGQSPEVAATVCLSVWVILSGWAALRIVRWPCPQCGYAWLANQEPRLGAVRRCAHCGLGLYESPRSQP